MDIKVAKKLATVKGLWMHDYHIISSWCFWQHSPMPCPSPSLQPWPWTCNINSFEHYILAQISDGCMLRAAVFLLYLHDYGKLRLWMFSYHQFSASKYQFHVSFNCILLECLIWKIDVRVAGLDFTENNHYMNSGLWWGQNFQQGP